MTKMMLLFAIFMCGAVLALLPLNLHADPGVTLKLAFSPKNMLMKLYETFPPIDDIVIQNFHFFSNYPITVNLHDRFCTGNSFRAYDNFQIVVNEESILNFCGISADNLKPIVNPDFKEVEFPLLAGEHFLTVVVIHSPIGGKKTSLRITLKPGEEQCEVVVAGMETKFFARPKADYAMCDFEIAKFRSTGRL